LGPSVKKYRRDLFKKFKKDPYVLKRDPYALKRDPYALKRDLCIGAFGEGVPRIL